MPPIIVSNFRLDVDSRVDPDVPRVKVTCYNPEPDMHGHPGVTPVGESKGKTKQGAKNKFFGYEFFLTGYRKNAVGWMVWVEGAGNKTLFLMPEKRFVPKPHQKYPEQTVDEIGGIIATLPIK